MLLKTRKRTYLPLLYYRAKSGKICSACGQRCVHPAWMRGPFAAIW